MIPKEKAILELIFPEQTFEWFDIVDGHSDGHNVFITLEEKNIPPITEELIDKKIIAKKFRNITITDFPIRGKRTLLTFRRRYWQIEGHKEYLKRDIKLSFPGTQINQEFANFLKENGGSRSCLSEFYRKVSSSPSKRI